MGFPPTHSLPVPSLTVYSAATLHAELIRWFPPAHSLPIPSLTVYSAATLHAEFPTIAIGIVKPETHVRRTRRFRADLVTRILNLDLVLFQMRQRLSQDRHIGQMKRHVIESLRRRLSFKQRDGDVVVADRNSVVEFKLFAQPDDSLKPAGALLWIAYGQTEMADHAERNWYFHVSNKSWEWQN